MQPRPPCPCHAAHSEVMRQLIGKRVHLRNRHHTALAQWRSVVGVNTDGNSHTISELVRMLRCAALWPRALANLRPWLAAHAAMVGRPPWRSPLAPPQAACADPPSPPPPDPGAQTKNVARARKLVAESGAVPAGSTEVDLLSEMVAYGDSGAFMDRVRELLS